jgi:hypothetical protein
MANNQDWCPFTRTNKNDKVRFSPPSERAATCFQLHDDLRVLNATAHLNDDKAWLEAANKLKMSLEFAKKARGPDSIKK